MSLIPRLLPGLAAIALAAGALAQPDLPRPVTHPVPMKHPPMKETNDSAPLPAGESPVDFFRQLLRLAPAEQNRLLANRPPASRARILAKVREYESLDPDEREMRLRATELRWYLLPLMRLAPAGRTNRLAAVPADLRPLIKSRLLQWDLLPPPLQQEFLTNDNTRYFAQAPGGARTEARAERIADQFGAFFKITPEEKRRLLDTLSESDRAQMERTLKTFEGLPSPQQLLCVRNYAKFAGMSEAERAEFLKNADSWSKMSASERQSWRDLVAHVPRWPPMPSVMPPLPPPLAPNGANNRMATTN